MFSLSIRTHSHACDNITTFVDCENWVVSSGSGKMYLKIKVKVQELHYE